MNITRYGKFNVLKNLKGFLGPQDGLMSFLGAKPKGNYVFKKALFY